MKELVTRITRLSKRLLMLSIVLLAICGMRRLNTTNAATTSPYLIKVNKQQNCVTIYEKDKKGKYTVPVKAMICSTGSDTPLGTYRTPARYRWKVLLDGVWGQYCTRITGGILFHSVWYYKQDPSTLSAKQYNNLGIMCSHGCIRLTVEDAKWIYDNCPLGTTVTIYNDKNPGPLGKPVAIKLPANTGWDPTDVYSKNNPFNNKKPSITGAKSKTIKYGTKINLLQGIKAKNTTGFDITSRIQVSGSVNVKKAGKYKITYSVVDEIGRSAKKTITITVLAEEGKPKLTGVKDRVIDGSTEVNRDLALKGVSATIGNTKVSKSDIKVTIVDNKDNTFTVSYEVVSSSGSKAEAEARITVDDQAPEILGIKDKTIMWGTEVNREFALDGVKICDNYSDLTLKDIKVIIKEKEDRYVISYSAQDGVGNKVVLYANYVIEDYLYFEGVKDHIITSTDVVDENYVLNGVKAYYKGKDITDTIQVTINKIAVGDEFLEKYEYDVTYTIWDSSKRELKVTAKFAEASVN